MLHIDYKLIYLICTLVIFAIYILVLLIRKDLRKIMLITSALLVLTGPVSEILFYKDYWYPPTFLDIQIFGIRILIEDFLFAFVAPTLGALLYLILFNHHLDGKLTSIKNYILRFSLFALPLLILFFGITLIGNINSILSITISALINSAVILYVRRDLLKTFFITSLLSGAATFFFYYIIILIIGKSYLYSVWLLNHQLFGFHFLGSVIPLTEVLFSAAVMPFIAILILFSSKLKIK